MPSGFNGRAIVVGLPQSCSWIHNWAYVEDKSRLKLKVVKKIVKSICFVSPKKWRRALVVNCKYSNCSWLLRNLGIENNFCSVRIWRLWALQGNRQVSSNSNFTSKTVCDAVPGSAGNQQGWDTELSSVS